MLGDTVTFAMMPNSSVAAPLALLFLTAAGSMAAAGAEEVTAGPVLGKTTVPPLSLTRPGERSTPLSTSAAASGTVPFSKPNCTFYFGSDVDDDSLQITVVDPDVAAGYPLGDKTFMHHTGPGSACISPGPPAGCHRYFKVGCSVSPTPAAARGFAAELVPMMRSLTSWLLPDSDYLQWLRGDRQWLIGRCCRAP